MLLNRAETLAVGRLMRCELLRLQGRLHALGGRPDRALEPLRSALASSVGPREVAATRCLLATALAALDDRSTLDELDAADALLAGDRAPQLSADLARSRAEVLRTLGLGAQNRGPY